jgi:Phosphoribosyl transferase domain
MSDAPPPPLRRDHRGNRLLAWAPQPSEVGHRLWLRATDDVVAHVRQATADYRQLDLPAGYRGAWSHLLYSRFPLRIEVADLLELLTRTVTLPTPPTMTTALALDWYKVPDDAVDARSWANTTAGEWVTQGKYWYEWEPDRQDEVGLRAARALVDAVASHPVFVAATVVVDVPGHDTLQVSFGSRLAATVARETEKPFVPLSCTLVFRPEAKNLTDSQHRAALHGAFRAPEPLPGARVLVVDDVFRSGRSMAEAARACRDAGAATVSGLCVVRTMRS